MVHSEHSARFFILTTVDETGTDRRSHIRKYGYALRGTTPEYTRPFLGHGTRVNAIIGISSKAGITALEMTTSSVNAKIFFDFVRGSLIPNMQQFDGENPRSIVVMEFTTLMKWPIQNPAEECFSYV